MRDAERFAADYTGEWQGPADSFRSRLPRSSSVGMPRKRCAMLARSRARRPQARALVHHKPAGIAVLVTPWNFPPAMATRKIGLHSPRAARLFSSLRPIRRSPCSR